MKRGNNRMMENNTLFLMLGLLSDCIVINLCTKGIRQLLAERLLMTVCIGMDNQFGIAVGKAQHLMLRHSLGREPLADAECYGAVNVLHS